MSSLPRIDPEELIRRARAGDGDALGSLLDSYRNYLKLLARLQIGRRLQGKADPSDVVQEACLDAHRNFGRFRGTTEKELAGWLREILVANMANLVRHYYGTKRRNVRLERELAADLDQSSRALQNSLAVQYSSPSERAARREESVLLADALEGLSDDHREVLVLRHIEGLPFPDVARRMGRSVEAVKKLWARALARLQAAMGEK